MILQEMTKSECLRALARTRLGRLACTHDGQPYVVPIYFVYEEPYLYGFTTPGLKVEWMRCNPLVCVEFDAVESGEQWASILVFGWYEELPGNRTGDNELPGSQEPSRRTTQPSWEDFGERERLHAYELLQRHAGWWEPGCASASHRNPGEPMTPVFYRIRIDRVTGRRARPGRDGSVRSKASPTSPGRQGWLARVFYALSRPFASRRGKDEYGSPWAGRPE